MADPDGVRLGSSEHFPSRAFEPQVVLESKPDGISCDIDEEGLEVIRARARLLLKSGIGSGFEGFPVKKEQLMSDVENAFLSKENIRSAFTAGSGATNTTHNALRNRYKTENLNPDDALERGLVARRVMLKGKCPAQFDWANSPIFNDVDGCEDVLEEMEVGMPMVMYMVPLPQWRVEDVFGKLSTAIFYSQFNNSGPVACASPQAKAGNTVTYQSYKVNSIYVLDFIIEITKGRGWAAWHMLKSCTADGGKLLSYDDLKFDNGVQAYIPIDVSIDGRRESYTLIIAGIAAASSSSLAWAISDNAAYYRYIGGEFAKKLLLEATANDWKIE